jgi:O-antigen ligase
MGLALLPLAVAGGIAGLATLVSAITADEAIPLVELGVLDRPIGYHNANAAFFAICFFAALGIATDRDRDWRLRGTMVGTATLCAGLVVLSQSRGSVLAAVVGVIAFVALSRIRVRAILYLAAALLPVALVMPFLLDVYSAAADGDDPLDALQLGSAALGVASVVAALIGATIARAGAVINPSPRTIQRAERAVTAVVGGTGLLISAAGDPVDWVNQRFDEFRQGGDPELQESRFAFNAGSERYDYWRVAIDDAVDDPLVGSGGGGFQYSYNREGESEETPRDAHSVELELLSEQGILALLAFVVFVIAAMSGALRSRRLGPAATALVSAALGAGAYWLVHASIEWFWTFPGVTAPVMFLLGAACAPAMLAPERAQPSRRARIAAAAGVIVLALTMVPPYLSERYVNKAYEIWRDNPEDAYAALDHAASLNPLSDSPLLAEGAMALERGDDERALGALREAIELKPDEWAGHYYLGLLLAEDAPEAARVQLEIALRRSPRSDEVAKALNEIEAQQGEDAPPGL